VETAFGGTFDWIWLNEELSFTNWLQHGPGIFWVSGKPGSGKSTIMKYLAQHPRTYETLLVSNNNAMGQIPIITIHFFDYKGTAMNRSLEGLLRSLLWQIISQNPIVGNAVFLAFEDMKRKQGSINWSKAKLLTVFKRIIQEMWSFPLCIFVDALDEYVNPQSNTSQDSYTEVAEFFRNLTLTMPSTTRLCLASRFSAEFSYQFGGFPRFLLQHHTTDDIKAYACSKFADMISQEEPSYHILVNHVVQEAQGIFQWVRLVCEVILRCWRRKESLQRLQQRLHEMPKALGDLYQRILDELDDAERVEAGLILGIVACSARPLSPVELQYIVSNAGKDHILFTVDLRGRIEAICSGLVDVGPRQVRLSHETVLVFFQKYHSQVLRDGNLCVLRSCMAILSAAIKNKDVLVGREHSDFAKYAVLEWVKHAKQANSEGAGLQDKDWKPLTNSEFLIWYEIFLSVSWETPDFDRGRTYKVIDDSERTHKFSVRRVLEILVFRTLNIAISSKLFRSPSHWEKWSWRSPCLFLQDISSGIGLYTNTKIISDDGTHYLHCFLGGEKQPGEVFNGSELSQSTAFVEHLLKRNLDFIDTASLDDKFFTGNQSSDHELDPVLAADFALVLLDRRPFDSLVKLHVDDFFCRGEMTPMQLAAYRGIDQLLQILLENGANPNLAMRESAFGTPLLAAIYGLSHAKKSITVEPTYACFIMLLQRGADPNQNAFGYTLDESRSPLELAIIFLAVRIRDVERAGRRRVDGKELARQVKAGYSIHVNAEITNMAWVIKVLCSFGAFPNLATRQRIRAMPELCDYFAFGRFIERGFIERAQQRDTDTGCFDPAPSSSPASPFGMLYRATASAYTPREDIAGSSVYQLRATAPSTSRKVHKRH
jgi:hypothetical protein